MCFKTVYEEVKELIKSVSFLSKSKEINVGKLSSDSVSFFMRAFWESTRAFDL